MIYQLAADLESKRLDAPFDQEQSNLQSTALADFELDYLWDPTSTGVQSIIVDTDLRASYGDGGFNHFFS